MLQFHQELQRPVEHSPFMRQGHGGMPFHETHPNVEIQRPVGLAGNHAGIHPKIVVTFVLQAEVALGLTRDVLEWPIGQGAFIKECERLIDTQRPVHPVPAIAVLGQRKQLRVIP